MTAPADIAQALLEEYAWGGPAAIARILDALDDTALDRLDSEACEARLARAGLVADAMGRARPFRRPASTTEPVLHRLPRRQAERGAA